MLAATFLFRGRDTRAARLFRALALPEVAESRTPDWEKALARLAEALSLPLSERSARIAEAMARARRELADAATAGLDLVGLLDPGYPPLLREIPDPPIVLWQRGTLPGRPAVALVGSRRASPEGLLMARRLARDLSRAGLTVVSGLALGIDAAAHVGALDGPGATVAVLGSGLDVIYPAAHRELADRIATRGCLLSEFLPGTGPRSWHFPVRNRVISGLSRAVVVVEAAERSGSLITARAALEQGRDVLAVPGGVSAGGHRGCHALIKDGARLVETVDDVLDELGWGSEGARRVGIPDKSRFDSDLLNRMATGSPVDLDVLTASTGRAAADVLAELGRLELDGAVGRLPGGQFVRLD